MGFDCGTTWRYCVHTKIQREAHDSHRLAAEHKADLRIFRTFRHIEAPGLHYNLLAKASDAHIGRQMKGNVSGAKEIANTAEKPSGQGSWHSRPAIAFYHCIPIMSYRKKALDGCPAFVQFHF